MQDPWLPGEIPLIQIPGHPAGDRPSKKKIMERAPGQYEETSNKLDSNSYQFLKYTGPSKIGHPGNAFLPPIDLGGPEDDS